MSMEVVDRPDRDSHDLSYLATRFSVVDSMLSSLSGFPTNNSALADYSTTDPDFDDELYASAPKRPTPSNTGRRRGHTQSSSVDNYDIDIDDLSTRYTDYHSRGRANGAANLPQRRNNRADNGRQNSALKRPSIDVKDEQLAEASVSRHTRGTTIKGSKSSGSSSMDMGYTNGVPSGRYGAGPGPSRAASFDHSYSDRVPRSSPQRYMANTAMTKSPTQPVFDYANMDAAPTPTIPAGPRKPQEPLSPILANAPPLPKAPVPTRKNSVKSTTSKAAKKAKSNTMDPALRDQAKQFVQATNNMRSVYATTGAAPSPTVGGPRRQNPPLPSNPPKERPGFFRRLFGSDKANDENRRPPSPPPLPNVPITNLKRPATQGNAQHIASQMKSNSRPSTQDAPPSSSSSMPNQTLKKSHSSFFRRRKKSISENPPPVPPLQLQQQQSQPNLAKLNVNPPQLLNPTQISPSVSSLRRVMDPYLTEQQAQSPEQMFFDTREHQPLVDPGDGSLRAIENGRLSQVVAQTMALVPDREASNLEPNGLLKADDSSERDPSNTESSSAPNKIRRGRVDVVGGVNERSFLADSSGNESMAGGDSPEDSQPSHFGDPLKIPRSTLAPTSSPYTSAYVHATKENIPPPSRAAPTIVPKPSLHVHSQITDRSLDPRPPSPPHGDEDDDDGYVVPAMLPQDGSLKSHPVHRVWLKPSSSEEKLTDRNGSFLNLPLEGPRTSERPLPASPTSDGDVFASATSLPILQVDSHELQESWVDVDTEKAILVNDSDVIPADRERARQIFEGEEDSVLKAEAAAWLGQNTPKASRTRKAYMEMYDWTGCNILAAFRELCSRLVVKAESQQLDRVIDAFSERWCSCNSTHGFKDRDVVHTITYSVLMLNTDLHVADMDQRMTRSQFVRNTLPTIRNIAEAAEAESLRKQGAQSRGNSRRDNASSPSSPIFPIEGRASEDRAERPSLEIKRSRNRLSIRPPMRQDSDGPEGSSTDNCNVLVNAPFNGGMKSWEFQVEVVLKEFYNSIRAQRLPLHGAPRNQSITDPQSTNSLAIVANALRRSPSVLSKAPSDSVSYRGRGNVFKNATERFGPRRPSRPRIYPTSTVGSSRTSLDDQSVFSPAASTWSKYSLGKTQTSLSVDSFGSHFAQGDYQQAIGFANALSQAIIREEAGSMGANSGSVAGNSEQEFGRSMPLLEDDSLELVGPPWAKEGIVKHRHHLESLEKKAKDRGWNECFAVIEKGWMSLFNFNPSKSTSKAFLQRQRARSKSGPGAVVGGGNWTENAEKLGAFLLRQTIASALPPPGFSKSRPHVFALSLPTGAVHLFSVGTAEIVKEFVSTANYWSARLSKEPLIGGVSNIEYGWSDAIVTAVAQLDAARADAASPTPGSAHGSSSAVLSPPRSAVASPLASPTHAPGGSMSLGRTSLDQALGGGSVREQRARALPGDRAQISDWSPPVQSMMASNLMEIDQLKALSNYVAAVEDDLRRHNELRSLMSRAVREPRPLPLSFFLVLVMLTRRNSTRRAAPTPRRPWPTGRRRARTCCARS